MFSDDWVRAWRDEINADPEYAEAGRGWTGSILLRARDGDGDGDGGRQVFLDLAGGYCMEARPALPEDADAARLVITGSPQSWVRVMAGGLDPVLELLGGALSLEKGSVMTLLPHQAGARALVRTAMKLEEATRSTRRGSGSGTRPRHPGPRAFQAVSGRGLDHDLFPMRLYHKAKKLGVWDPRDLDLDRDREDWLALEPLEQDLLLRLSSFFQAGEEAVARDLLPLIQVISHEGRLEEEMYLATFFFEEAKHVELFRRFLDEVAPEHGDLARFESPAYRTIFVEELPTALFALRGDASPRAQIRAAVTYNMIVEGVLAETGYLAYDAILERRGILPGMREGVRLLKRDESRHIAYGLYLISRLVAEDPELWSAVQADLSRLLEPALAVVRDIFRPYPTMPFGLELEEFTELALNQFQARLRRLETAREAGRLVEED